MGLGKLADWIRRVSISSNKLLPAGGLPLIPHDDPSVAPLQPKIGYDPDGSGYHFKRHDFDPDWDNDAECTIADMEFNPETDSEVDRRHKLRVLQIYNM